MKKNNSAALALNIIIFILVVFSVISTLIGFQFMGEMTIMMTNNISAFKFFTFDSNILAGIVSLVYIIYVCRIKKKVPGKTFEMPRWFTMLKLASTTGVTLTMMVTVFFLAPTSSKGYFALFMNSNLFFHFVIPMLSVISFIFFEPAEKLSLRQTLTGIIPMFIYSVFYSLNVVLHMNNGQSISTYDFYGFLGGKISRIWFVMPAIYLLTWSFSLLLWVGNKKIVSKK